MENMAQLLKEHFLSHPDMEIQDGLKFLYQSYMGPGHLLTNQERALARLQEEWTQVEPEPCKSRTEPLGNGMCRLHLNACKGIGLSSKTLFSLTLHSARQAIFDLQGFQQALELIDTLPFPHDQVKRALAQYRSQGCPPVGHSSRYRTAYAPAYRVVMGR